MERAERQKRRSGMDLKEEKETFEKHRKALVAVIPGEFVLIKDGDIICSRESCEVAIDVGEQRFGIESDFLVEEVLEKPRVYIT